MKINFNNIIVKTIDGNETKVEIAKDLAAVLYKSSIMLEGLEVSRQLYHEGEVEVTAELAGIIKDIAKANFFAVVQEALNPILDSIIASAEETASEEEVQADEIVTSAEEITADTQCTYSDTCTPTEESMYNGRIE